MCFLSTLPWRYMGGSLCGSTDSCLGTKINVRGQLYASVALPKGKNHSLSVRYLPKGWMTGMWSPSFPLQFWCLYTLILTLCYSVLCNIISHFVNEFPVTPDSLLNLGMAWRARLSSWQNQGIFAWRPYSHQICDQCVLGDSFSQA
jgi:hypothetical protein